MMPMKLFNNAIRKFDILNKLSLNLCKNLENASPVGVSVRSVSNRSKRGLYDGRDVGTGNNVPFSLKKTKRKFKPNVFTKRLYSEILDEMIRFHVTTGALRTIDKMGGLDEYLLKSDKVTQGEGWRVKHRLLQKIENCEKKGVNVLDQVVFRDEKGNAKKVL